jgi:hypothetical protein
MVSIEKRRSALLVTIMLALLCGCGGKVERIVRVTDTSQNLPATNNSFFFVDNPELEPLVKADEPVKAMLDTNGEARVQLPKVRGWARIEAAGTNYVAGLEPADIEKGGQFRLYGPRPAYSGANRT